MARVFIVENKAISSENVPRRGLNPRHLFRDCPRRYVNVVSGRPEQGNGPVSHLTSDRVVRLSSRGETEKLGSAEDRIVELEGRLLEAETLEVQLRQKEVSLQAGQEQMRVQAEEQHSVANENFEVSRKHRHLLAAWRQPHNLVGRKANAYHWCRMSHISACL